MSDSTRRPALTPDEWDGGENADATVALTRTRGGRLCVTLDNGCSGLVTETDRHALAALALHGQPFGFTWADVDRVRRAIIMERYEAVPDSDERRALDDIAARLADLLPPREQEPK